MTSVRVILAIFVCLAAVHSSMQDETEAKKREELLQLVQKLESTLKREAKDNIQNNEELLSQETERQAKLKREKKEEIKRKQQVEEFRREAKMRIDELKREAANKIEEKIEQEKKEHEEKYQEETKRLAEELSKMTQDEDENILKRNGACANRLKGKKCQLLRWFRKSCNSVQMKRDCKASCGKC